eukprot:CAMPEP_0170566652 /NCGR_PEP_ID=MMETSP0211-20121228/79979_1 /TAXON_ID=311385 /ORGANISM="Pseudokeronopsis sp., Strain OXSARD2" /LENGTH=108 /DNA_ID=CAMNT_0010887891 /DNA_START=383 /DNA_END=709 /DNA_ORIENTATION=-
MSISKAVVFERRGTHGEKSMMGNLSKITVIEIGEPLEAPQTACEIFKGVIMMKLAILCLCASGILLKYHYTINPLVTTYDMVFVRAFSQLLISYLLCIKDNVNIVDIP